MELAIREAIENAVEHTHQADPTIDVGVLKNDNQTDPDSVEITIADNGPGIPEQERIPLEQGNETSLQHSSGLGLWKIKWITNDNGGTVTITENEPNGTVVTFTLPAIASATTLEIETP
ncbi:MAG: sensor histidine kinase [Halobacteriaceae archaeon]